MARGVAQNAPVPTRTLLHLVPTNRTAAQSSSFLALMVGVLSTLWQEDPTQLCPPSRQDAEFLLWLWIVSYPMQDISGGQAIPPPHPPPPVDFARYVKN